MIPGSSSVPMPWLPDDLDVVQTRTDAALLDACASLIGQFGERNLTIDQVAERAGRSRMTVFRRFGTREDLITATYRRELRRVVQGTITAAEGTTDLVDRAELIVSYFVDSAFQHPVSVALLKGEPDAVVNVLRGGPDFSAQQWAVELFAALLADSALDAPLARPEAEFVGGLLMRIIVSLLLLPEPAIDESRAARRSYIRRVAERVVGP
ncbi:TetR/AcrR family transcriptional regulator [Gordonia rubripertincta]|jgi:AcrR family transcriptional regulator|uniref:TetR/AcrR family transcriptional regulator n=1 Tax=Gordonia rubripertincta TaxID=36822 RepID=UPI000B8D6DDD|nr:TetR/AcrR family transcriptional regulator [Gordonia rubripertincta]ASR01198.1 transcriptional regulator BetI [Gordonia rubripertincta]